jgi:hypothetical protein
MINDLHHDFGDEALILGNEHGKSQVIVCLW